MERDEWQARCAARYKTVAGLNDVAAMQAAEATADVEHEEHGASAIAWTPPEEAADEDMACWDDDGD